MALLPRPIKPELIELGDTVVVSYPPDAGIVVRREGTVKAVERYGGTVCLLTAERAPILRYVPGQALPGVKVVLMRRAPAVQQPLSLFEELAERLA